MAVDTDISVRNGGRDVTSKLKIDSPGLKDAGTVFHVADDEDVDGDQSDGQGRNGQCHDGHHSGRHIAEQIAIEIAYQSGEKQRR